MARWSLCDPRAAPLDVVVGFGAARRRACAGPLSRGDRSLAGSWRDGPTRASLETVSERVCNLLLCDEERATSDLLAAELRRRGHAVTVARTCSDAFAAACAHDYDALVVAPYLRDGSTLVLPSSLGIRRPPLVVLVTRLAERLAAPMARRVGFDAQLTKIVDPWRLDRMVRWSVAATAAAKRQAAREREALLESQAPASEVGGRIPR